MCDKCLFRKQHISQQHIINSPKSWTDKLQPAQRGPETFSEDLNQPPLQKHSN